MNRAMAVAALVMVSLTVVAAPMDSYQVGSGFGTVDTMVWFRTLLYAGIGLYGCWAIGVAVWGWVQGQVNELTLFSVVFRSALVLFGATLLVGVVT